MNFADNLRVLRERSGMTQEQLAERMEVSRQTVSKWESETSFPEMEKMIQLTEVFGCTMDGLLKGNMRQADQKEEKLYEAHGNKIAKMATAATAVCILSLAAQAAGDCMGFPFWSESGLPFLLGALVGGLLWLRVGMDSTHFRKKHPYVEPFYTEEQKEAFHNRYMTVMTVGIGILIASLIVTAAVYAMLGEREESVGNLVGGGFLVMIAVGVSMIVYIALQASKYNVEGYNADNAWDNSEEGKANGRRIGKACAVIMMAATALFLILWYAGIGIHFSALTFAVGGILCGVASVLLNRRKD